jgi:hypothetical protein
MSRARGIVGPHSVFDRILFFSQPRSQLELSQPRTLELN